MFYVYLTVCAFRTNISIIYDYTGFKPGYGIQADICKIYVIDNRYEIWITSIGRNRKCM